MKNERWFVSVFEKALFQNIGENRKYDQSRNHDRSEMKNAGLANVTCKHRYLEDWSQTKALSYNPQVISDPVGYMTLSPVLIGHSTKDPEIKAT